MIKKVLPFILLAALVYACSSDSSDNPSPTDNFDRGAMLTHLADNIIVPAFQEFDGKLATLQSKVTSFTDAPNTTTLTQVRAAWLDAYKAWQHVEMFNIGKAEEIGMVYYFNIYPVTVADIEYNITQGTYDLSSPNNHDAQGFPALDYMFYGVAENDTAILAKYTTDAKAANYKKYVTDVVAKMRELMTVIVNDWNGSYLTQFVSSTANTATSSLNKLVNDYVYAYEKGLRANKFGIPAGVFSATSLPEKVEGYYSKAYSKALALEALNAAQDFFNGNNFGRTGSGVSLKSYLIYLERNDLVNLINNQFGVAKNQISTLNDDFYQQINTDNTQMTKAFDELQKVVLYLKVDMLQAFNVSVDYADADGD
ncbi:imelysin family protein [Tenacibaculum sp.]|uniref:imelysin family protein n=1 Tax=Tenacibaculum sp. TaxID=1906242 RepID=UPI003D0F4632